MDFGNRRYRLILDTVSGSLQQGTFFRNVSREPTNTSASDSGAMSLRDPSKEGFIDRHQLWPFYRRRRFCDETMEAVREVWREMDEGYTADDYPEAKISRNISDGSDVKYVLVEKPNYIKGRERMADRGYNLDDLDYVIGVLCHGDPLPPRYRNHKLKGDKKGYMECHIAYDWLLVYQYNNRENELILYAIDTGTHEDLYRDRSDGDCGNNGQIGGQYAFGIEEEIRKEGRRLLRQAERVRSLHPQHNAHPSDGHSEIGGREGERP